MSLDKDLQCREIITKAVCGKGRKFSHSNSYRDSASFSHQYFGRLDY